MLWFFQRPLPFDDGGSTHYLRPHSGFGDHLMLTAVLEGIRKEKPDIRFRLVARHPELFHRAPNVDEAYSLRRMKKYFPDRLARYRDAGHRPPEARLGQESGHLIDDVYDAVGIATRDRPRQPIIRLSPGEEQYRRRWLDGLPGPRVAVVAHGKPDVRLPNKVYPADQWTTLAGLLVRETPTVLQLGSSLDGPALPGAHDLRDIGFRKTAAVLRRCDLLICHVGGIMHLAAATRTPAVVLYGAAEHPSISGYPWNRNLFTPITCGPCWRRDVCPHHTCMRFLTPELVIAQFRTALEHLRAGREVSTNTPSLAGAIPPPEAAA